MKILHLLAVLLLAVCVGGCAITAPEPAETERVVRAATSAVVAQAFGRAEMRKHFKPDALRAARTVIDAEVVPALRGDKPISAAAARGMIIAVDLVLARRDSPPLAEVTAATIDLVAAFISTRPPDELLSPQDMAALRGFVAGLSDGLERAIDLYPKDEKQTPESDNVDPVPPVRPALRLGRRDSEPALSQVQRPQRTAWACRETG